MDGFVKSSRYLSGVSDTVHLLAQYDDYNDYNIHIDMVSDMRGAIVDLVKLGIAKELGWFDDLTAEVAVSMFTHNPESDTITSTKVTFTVSVTGQMSSEIQITTNPLTSMTSPYKMALLIIVTCFMVFSLFGELFEVVGVEFDPATLSLRRTADSLDDTSMFDSLIDYFSLAWNWLDLIRVGLWFVFLSQLMAIESLVQDLTNCTAETLSMTLAANCLTTTFDEIAEHQESMMVANALLVLIHMIWIMKYFRHKRLAVVRDTIYESSDDLWHFLIVFFIIYMGFTYMATLFFGDVIESYNSISISFLTCFQILLGEFDYDAMRDAFPIGAAIFFWTYMLVCSFVLFNITIGIVCAAYDVAKEGPEDKGSVFKDAVGGFSGLISWIVRGGRAESSKVDVEEAPRKVEDDDLRNEETAMDINGDGSSSPPSMGPLPVTATELQSRSDPEQAARLRQIEADLRAIYALYKPSKLASLPEQLEKYKGKEHKLLAKVKLRYGPLPGQDPRDLASEKHTEEAQ